MTRWGAQRLLLRADARHHRVETLLGVILAFVSAAVLTAAGLAYSAERRSFGAEARALDAPPLLLTVPTGTTSASFPKFRAPIDRVSAPISSVRGTVAAGSHDLAAQLLAGGALPAWVRIAAGTGASGAPAAFVEQGAAASLHVRVGSSVRITGPTGQATVRVAGVVGDLSRSSYPLSIPAAVYLNAPAGRAVGVERSPATQTILGLWTAPGATSAPILAAIAGAVGAYSSYSVTSLDNVPDGLHLLTSVTVTAVGVLGLLTLVGLVVLLACAVRLDVLRRERWIGQLRACGWPVGRLRRLLLAQRVPALLTGAVAGSVVGSLAGLDLARRLTHLYGAPADPVNPVVTSVVVIAVVLAVAAGALAWSTRRLAGRPIAAQLRAAAGDAPTRSRLGRLGRGGAVTRFGLAMAGGRRRRTTTVVIMTGLAVALAVSGSVVVRTLDHLTTDPAAWGLRYDWRVDLPSGGSATAAATTTARIGGVGATTPFWEGMVELGANGQRVPFVLTSSSSPLAQPVVDRGRRPTGGEEVEIGYGIADVTGAGPGSTLPIDVGGVTRSLRVVGVARDLEDQGTIIRGTPSLVADLGPAITDVGVLVQCHDRATCPAVGRSLAAADGGGWAVTDATTDIAFPFATTIRATALLLSLALALLAASGALYNSFVSSEELVPSYALLRALGARPRQLTLSAGLYTALILTPAVVAGVLVGLVGAKVGVEALTSSLGGLAADISPLGVAAAAMLVVVVSCAGVAAPFVRASRRAPVLSLRAAGQ